MANKVEVRGRVEPLLRAQVRKILEAQGMTVSEAIQLLMLEIAKTHGMPVFVKNPQVPDEPANDTVANGDMEFTIKERR